MFWYQPVSSHRETNELKSGLMLRREREREISDNCETEPITLVLQLLKSPILVRGRNYILDEKWYKIWLQTKECGSGAFYRAKLLFWRVKQGRVFLNSSPLSIWFEETRTRMWAAGWVSDCQPNIIARNQICRWVRGVVVVLVVMVWQCRDMTWQTNGSPARKTNSKSNLSVSIWVTILWQPSPNFNWFS